MPNLVTQLITRELEAAWKDAEGMLFVDFAGLTVQESEAMRNDLAAKGVSLRMIRNKLARRVLAERGVELDAAALQGNTVVAYGDAEAAIVAAKVFSTPEVKKAGKAKIKAGIMQGQVLDTADALALADVPDKDTLRAQILGALSGPARGLAMVLNALPSGVARVLQARVDEGEGE